jgi:hypothetical protein
MDFQTTLVSAPAPAAPGPVHLPDIWTTLDLAGIRIDLPDAHCLASREAAPVSPGGVAPRIRMVGRKRKHFTRTLFTADQRTVLMEWLHVHQQNPYPTASEKEHLMLKTGLHRDQINIWFTNHRMREGIRMPYMIPAGGMDSAHRFHP